MILEWLWNSADATADANALDPLCMYLYIEKDELNKFINRCVMLGLFVIKDGIFYSERLKDRKLKQIDKSNSSQRSAELRWNKAKKCERICVGNAIRLDKSRLEENNIGSNEPVVEIVKNKKKDTNVSSDAVYGNEFINYIAKVFKDNLGTQTMDGTTKENRYSASRLWKRVLKESNGDTNRAKENIRIAIENGFKNDWHARSMNKISYLEKNFLTLYKLSL